MAPANQQRTVFVYDFPGDVGGANTELWHTLKLWRSLGLDVAVIPPWGVDDQGDQYGRWAIRLAEIGCRIQSCPDVGLLPSVPGLAGSVVVSFCNPRFLSAAHRFRALGCRIVWAGCMTWILAGERRHYRQHGTFDRYVFQSRYQRNKLEPGLQEFGYKPEQGRLIRGAFDLAEFGYQPKPRDLHGVFNVCRISRAAVEKFPPHSWSIYEQIPMCRALALGFGPAVEAVTGEPPCWVNCFPAGSLNTLDVLRSAHAFVMPSACFENWPRVGLEAMAAGVPLVVDNRGGWREMIRHGETGFLCDSPEDFVRYASTLAADESLRLRVAQAARAAVEHFADPATIGAAWLDLLSDLETR